MLSISIRYGGKLSYAMRALGPMLGSNSSQTETALSQMLGHDGARRHTLLSKMLRHNSARTQDHSNTSIGLHQRSCAAVCDMFLGKNHGSHFITIKSIGKTHHPVPLRFAVNGSASARYASLPSTLATTRRRGGGARQNPAARDGRTARQRHAARGERAARQRPASHNGLARQRPSARDDLTARQRHAARDNRSRLPKPCSAGGSNGIRARTCTCTCTRSCSTRSAAIASTATSSTRNSAAPHRPEPHGTEAVDRRGQNTAITTFRSPAQPKGPGRSIFEAHSRTGEEPHSWTKRFRGSFRTDEGAPFK